MDIHHHVPNKPMHPDTALFLSIGAIFLGILIFVGLLCRLQAPAQEISRVTPVALEDIERQARAFFAQYSSLPETLGTSTIRNVSILCADPADNGTPPDCVATVTFTETFLHEGFVCVVEDFGTLSYTPSSGGFCPSRDDVQYQHLQYMDPNTQIQKKISILFTPSETPPTDEPAAPDQPLQRSATAYTV